MCRQVCSNAHAQLCSLALLHSDRGAEGSAPMLTMVNVKKRKGRVVIDSDSEDSASDDNLDQVIKYT